MRGERCDVAELDVRIAADVADVRAAVLRRCQLGQLTELSFPGGVLDAQADLSNACRDQSSGVVEMTYTPLVTSARDAECQRSTATYARKVLRYVMRRKTRVMDRMASRVFTGAQKLQRMELIVDRLEDGASRWAAGLQEGCPHFEEIYGRSAANFVRTLKERADCVVSVTHGNELLVCIPQVCGNGIREEPEECDDGNADDGDGCATTCTLN